MERRRRRARMYLQMAICYKTWFGLLFYPVSFLLLAEKLSRFQYSSSLARLLPVSALVLLLAADTARYWLGSHGNLQQQVVHLTAFLFLSLCPLVPCVLYCNFFAEHTIAFDVVAGSLFLALLGFEVVAAVVVLRGLLRQETSRFVRLREAAREKHRQDAMCADGALGSPDYKHHHHQLSGVAGDSHQHHRRQSLDSENASSSTAAC